MLGVITDIRAHRMQKDQRQVGHTGHDAANHSVSVGFQIGRLSFSGINISGFSGSSIPRQTIEAYLTADYSIWGDRGRVLRVGQRNDDLPALYQKYAVSSAAMLAAWNPYSELRSDAENPGAKVELVSEIDRLACIINQGTAPIHLENGRRSRVDLDTAALLAANSGRTESCGPASTSFAASPAPGPRRSGIRGPRRRRAGNMC
jgi:hypothetical protein